MHALDIAIIAAYLLSVVLLGVYLTWRTRRLKVRVCQTGAGFIHAKIEMLRTQRPTRSAKK